MKTTFQTIQKRILAVAMAAVVISLSVTAPVFVRAEDAGSQPDLGTETGTGESISSSEAAASDNSSGESGGSLESSTSSEGSSSSEDPSSSENPSSSEGSSSSENASSSEGSSSSENASSSEDSSSSENASSSEGSSSSENASSGENSSSSEDASSSEGSSSSEDASSSEGSSSSENSNSSEEDAGIMPLSADEISVTTTDDFLAAVEVADNKIRLDADISLPNELTITAGGITLNGNGHKIVLAPNNRLILKSNGMNVRDVTIEGNRSPVMQIWNNTTSVALTDVTIQSSASNGTGLQVGGGAVAVLSGSFVTRNFTAYAVQVQNASTLNVNGLTSHKHYGGSASTIAVQLVGAGNTLTDPSRYGTATISGSNTNYTFASSSTGSVIKVTQFSDLSNNATAPDVLFDIQADITLTGSPNLTGANIVVEGNGHTIDNGGGGNKITLQGPNQVLRRLTFQNYTSMGLQVYGGGSRSATVEDVTFVSDSGTIGLLASNAANLTLKGKISTSNHGANGAGIKINNNAASTVDMGGVTSWESTGEGAALWDANDGTNTFVPPAAVYCTKTGNGADAKYKVGPQEVSNQTEFNAAIANDNSIVKLGGDFTVDGEIRIANNIDIDGTGHTITLSDSAKLILTRTHEVRNLKLTGPSTNEAVQIDSTGADVTMTDVTIDGGATTRALMAENGVIISGGAKAAFEGTLTTRNHNNTFLVQDGSLLNLSGVTTHTSSSEVNAVVLAGQENGAGNRFWPSKSPVYDSTPVTSGADHKYVYSGTVPGQINIYTFQDLKDNRTQVNATLSIQNNLTLTENIDLTGANTVVEGNGKAIDNGGSFKITLKGNGQKVSDLQFKNYTSTGLQVYGNYTVTLEDVSFLPAANTGAVGLLLNSVAGSAGPSATITGSFTTSDHKGAGIRLSQNSLSASLKIDGGASYSSSGDTVAVQIESFNDNKTVEIGLNPSPFDSVIAGTSKNYYMSEGTRVTVTDQDTLEAALQGTAGTVQLDADFALNAAVVCDRDVNFAGNGKTITLGPGAKLVLKKKHTIYGLNLSGPAGGEAMEITGGADATIWNAVIDGTALSRMTVPENGVMVNGGAKAVFKGTLETSNHGNTFRVQENSTLDLSGVTNHTSANETNAAVLAGQEAGAANSLLSPSSPPYDTVGRANGSDRVYPYTGALSKIQYIYSYDDFAAWNNSTQTNIRFEIQNDITLGGNIALKGQGMTINGNGNTIDGDKQLTLQAAGQSIADLNFKDYTNAALQLYGNFDFTLTDVTFTAKTGNSDARGIFVNSGDGADGPRVTLTGIVSTINNRGAGIRVHTNPKSCTITLDSGVTYSSTGDVSAVQIKNANDDKKVIVNVNPSPFVDIVDAGTPPDCNYYTHFYEISDYATFQDAAVVGNAGRTVKIVNDFSFPADAGANVDFKDNMPEIVIDGDGHTVTLANGKYITLRGDQTLKNLTLKGHTGQAVSVYESQADAVIENVVILGEGNANTGISLSANSEGNGGKATLKNVTTSGHKVQGILIQRGSELLLQGTIASSGEKDALVSMHNQSTNVDENRITFLGAPYQPYDAKTVDNSSKKTIYRMFARMDVATEADLLAALAVPNVVISMKDNITLTGRSASISWNNLKALDGENHILSLGGKDITLRSQQTLQNLTLKGHSGQAVQVYGASADVALENVIVEGENAATTGILLNSGGKAAITNLSTSGHKSQGILVQRGSVLKLQGTIQSSGDANALVDNYADGVNTIQFPTADSYAPYDAKIEDPANKKTVYLMYTLKDVRTEDELLAALAVPNVVLSMKGDIALTEKSASISWNNLKALDGENHILSLGGKDITLRSQQTLQSLTLKGHSGQAVQVYGALADVVLENVIVEGENAATTGILLNSGGKAAITNLSTSGHKSQGILVQRGSALTLQGTIQSSGDASALVDNYADGVNTIQFPTADSYAPYDAKTEDPANKKTVYLMYMLKDVRTEDELLATLAVPNVVISMKDNITLTEKSADISWNNLKALDGENHILSLGGKDITLRSQQTLKSLTLKGHSGQAVQVYGASADVVIENVIVEGENVATTGILLNSGGKAAVTNLSTSGHKSQGILVQRGSALTLQGTIQSSGDASALVDNYADGVNTITFPTADSYAPYDMKTEDPANKKTVYLMYTLKDVRTEDELLAALAVPNVVLSMKGDITLTEKSADISWNNLKALDGENHILSLGGKDITLRSQQTLKNVTITGHTNQAVNIYGSNADVTLEKVVILGEGAASTGILVSTTPGQGGATATLQDVTTSGHKSQGILVQRGSTLTLRGTVLSSGDANALVDNYADGVNTIHFPTADSHAPYDLKTEDTANKKTIYQMSTVLEAANETELLAALKVPNAVIHLKSDIKLSPGTENIVWNQPGSLIGGGFTLDTGGVSLQISNAATLKEVTVTGYQGAKPGLTVSGGKAAVTLDGVTLKGGNAQAGLDVAGGAKVTVVSGGIATEGHTQQGIRVRGGSTLDMSNGKAQSRRDTASLNVVTVAGEADNTVKFPSPNPYEGPFTAGDKTGDGKERFTDTYLIFNRLTVTGEQELWEAIAQKNVKIVLGADIKIDPQSKYPADGEETGEILFPAYAKIDGAGHTVNLQNEKRASTAKQVRLVCKGKYAEVENLTVTGYTGNGLTIYRVSQATLDNVTMQGIPDKSTTGLVIQGSTVELKNISTRNHSARGVQITGQTTNDVTLPSIVTVSGKWSSVNDKMALKMILQPGDTAESTLADPEKLFFTSGKTKETSETGYTYAWNYYLTGESANGVSTEAELVKALTTTGSRIRLTGDIVFQSALSKWRDEDRKNMLIEVAPGVQLLGEGHEIDLKGKTGLIIKSGDVTMRDVTVKNAKQDGITAYNSRNVALTNVTLESCGRWGLVLNGSEVLVHDLTTRRNYAGGIQLSRSRTLRAASCTDSRLTIKGNIKHEEFGFNIQVKNVELLANRYAEDGTYAKSKDGALQDPVSRALRWTKNIVVRAENEEDTIAELYKIFEEPVKYNKLSDYYVDLFNFEEKEADEYYTDPPVNYRDPDVLYGEQEINYMATRHKLNVKYQDELKDGETPVRLLGSKATDPQAEKHKLERLVAFAATHGYLLYFPADTYTLCGDLDLTHLEGLPSLSNFGFIGDGDEPSILRACTGTDRCDCAFAGMLRIGSFNAGDGNKDYYRYPVYYMRAENMVFDNVGIAMDSAYKRGLEVINCVFLNGGYKGPYPKTKTISGEEVVGTEVELFPYVTANSLKSTITGNIFLRTREHAGKGVSVYRSKESLISSNIFGNPQYLSGDCEMFRVPGAMMRLEMIREFEKKLGLDLSQENGNFFTCINAVGYDENLRIQSNYFHAEPTKNVTISNAGAVNGIHFIQGLNETLPENWQRRDHIIYGKSYQNIYVENNYFYGQENGGAGGLKLRNGKGIYVGSNYFHNAPLLIYVYNDLAASGGSNVLSDAIIYNNTFQTNSNFGKSHAGILYYQSFQNTRKEFADIRNFVLYNNRFLSDYRDNVTISQNVLIGEVDRSKEFFGYGNLYACGASNVPAAASPDVPIPWNFTRRAKVNHGDRTANGSIGWQEVSQERILQQIEKSSVAAHFFDPDAESAPWKDAVPAIVPPVDYGYFDQVLGTAGGKVDPEIIRQAQAFRDGGKENTQAECNLWASYLIASGADEIILPVSGMEQEQDPAESMPDDIAEADTRFDDAEQTKDLEDKD